MKKKQRGQQETTYDNILKLLSRVILLFLMTVIMMDACMGHSYWYQVEKVVFLFPNTSGLLKWHRFEHSSVAFKERSCWKNITRASKAKASHYLSTGKYFTDRWFSNKIIKKRKMKVFVLFRHLSPNRN